MTIPALKPCPFGCAHIVDVELVEDPDVGQANRSWYVECGCCMCRGPWASRKDKAAELWNAIEEKK